MMDEIGTCKSCPNRYDAVKRKTYLSAGDGIAIFAFLAFIIGWVLLLTYRLDSDSEDWTTLNVIGYYFILAFPCGMAAGNISNVLRGK